MSVLTISLPDEQREFAESAVASGRYASLSDFFASLVSDAQRQARTDRIDLLLAEAEEETGEPVPGGPEFWQKMHDDLADFVRAEGLK